MEKSLPCKYELAWQDRSRLWRLSGLGSKTGDDPAGLRRLLRLRAIDLSPAAVGKPAPLRSATFPTDKGISSSICVTFNIQGSAQRHPGFIDLTSLPTLKGSYKLKHRITVPYEQIRTIMEPRWGSKMENIFTSPRVVRRKASLPLRY